MLAAATDLSKVNIASHAAAGFQNIYVSVTPPDRLKEKSPVGDQNQIYFT